MLVVIDGDQHSRAGCSSRAMEETAAARGTRTPDAEEQPRLDRRRSPRACAPGARAHARRQYLAGSRRTRRSRGTPRGQLHFHPRGPRQFPCRRGVGHGRLRSDRHDAARSGRGPRTPRAHTRRRHRTPRGTCSHSACAPFSRTRQPHPGSTRRDVEAATSRRLAGRSHRRTRANRPWRGVDQVFRGLAREGNTRAPATVALSRRGREWAVHPHAAVGGIGRSGRPASC